MKKKIKNPQNVTFSLEDLKFIRLPLENAWSNWQAAYQWPQGGSNVQSEVVHFAKLAATNKKK